MAQIVPPPEGWNLPSDSLDFGQDDHDDLVSSFAALQDTSNEEVASMAFDPSQSTSKLATGEDDVKNIFFIHFVPDENKLSGQQREAFKASRSDIDLALGFYAIRIGSTVQSKLDDKSLLSDTSLDSQVARSNLRAKVADLLVQKSPWNSTVSNEKRQQKYALEKKDFHARLLNDVLNGLAVPASTYPNLEGVLSTISNSIISSNGSQKSKMFWVMIAVYNWDHMLKVYRTNIRTIYFQASNEISTYASRKREMLSVDLNVMFNQGDYFFNRDVFQDPKESIQPMVASSGVKLPSKPIDVIY